MISVTAFSISISNNFFFSILFIAIEKYEVI
jgi:hypothetical protein